MGFFSRKSKKNKSNNANAKAAAAEEVPPTTPTATKEVPTTPETVKGTESPDPAAAAPVEDNESNVAAIQESQQQDEDKPATTTTKSKKKHRTRISVTTQENDEEEGEDEDDDDSSAPEIETFEAVDDRNISDEGDSQMMELNTTVDSAVNETGVDSTFDEEQAPDDEEKTSKNLLDTFEGCDILPDSLKAMLPESWQQTTATEETVVEEPPKKMSYYSDEFATNFLQELLKNGFALVYHQPSLTIEEENADWQGRSVTMNFKPGVCNALEVFQPEIEWSTMGGGKDKKILTRSVSMLDIHSIAVSSTNDMRDNLEAGEQEEIQCFFTMTTKSGDIHVFEAMSIDESNRLVLGIKNICGRYSNLVVAGDPRVMVEFFDNSSDPQEIRLPFERAIVQVSHAFLG